MTQIEDAVRKQHPVLPEPEGEPIVIERRERLSFSPIAKYVIQNSPQWGLLRLSLMTGQAFLYNAIFFTYTLVLTDFFGVNAKTAPLYLIPFATLARVLKWILATWRQPRLLRPTGHDPAPPAGSPRGAAAMRSAGHPSKAAANRQPDALLAELERTSSEFERAERAARTYLVGQGVLDQTQVDLVAALKRSDARPSKSTDQPAG